MLKTLQILLLFMFACSVGSSQYIKFNAYDSIDGFELEIDSIEFKNLNNDFEKTFYSDSIKVPKVSSVAASSYESEVRVYPNPAEDELNIKFSSNSTNQSDVKIFDLNGRELYNSDVNITQGINQFKFNISGLNRGMYLIKVANEVEKFIKSSDGQSKEINSTDIGSRSLIKENEIQSQFDYKFRVYSKNYRPKYYYLKKLEFDTVVNIKLSPEPTPFKNRFVKVELFLKDAVFKYYYITNSGGDYEETRYDTIDYEIKFIDSLYFRGNEYYSKYFQDSLRDDCRYDCFEERIISFNVDTVNQYIENLSIKYYKHLEYESGEWYIEDEIKEEISLYDPIEFDSFYNISISHSLEEVDLDYLKRTYNYESILSSHYKYYTFEEILGLENSYIKIEFTDTK